MTRKELISVRKEQIESLEASILHTVSMLSSLSIKRDSIKKEVEDMEEEENNSTDSENIFTDY